MAFRKVGLLLGFFLGAQANWFSQSNTSNNTLKYVLVAVVGGAAATAGYCFFKYSRWRKTVVKKAKYAFYRLQKKDVWNVVRKGNVDQIEVFLNGHRALVKDKDSGGQTLLHVAASGGCVDMVQCLLNHGAFINAKDSYGYTPLHRAAQKGHNSVAKLLLDRWADMDKKNFAQQTPLHLAVRVGSLDMVTLLLDKAIEVREYLELRDHAGQSALHLAAETGKEEIVRLLLNKGANVHAQDDRGQRVIDKAFQNKHGALGRFLLCGGEYSDSIHAN